MITVKLNHNEVNGDGDCDDGDDDDDDDATAYLWSHHFCSKISTFFTLAFPVNWLSCAFNMIWWRIIAPIIMMMMMRF